MDQIPSIIDLLAQLTTELADGITFCYGAERLIRPANRVQRHRKAKVLWTAHSVLSAVSERNPRMRERGSEPSADLSGIPIEIAQVVHDVVGLVSVLRSTKPTTESVLDHFVASFRLSLKTMRSRPASLQPVIAPARTKRRRRRQLKLTELEASVYRASQVEGLSVQEIALMRNCTKQNVYRALQSATMKVNAIQASSRSVHSSLSLEENIDSPLK